MENTDRPYRARRSERIYRDRRRKRRRRQLLVSCAVPLILLACAALTYYTKHSFNRLNDGSFYVNTADGEATSSGSNGTSDVNAAAGSSGEATSAGSNGTSDVNAAGSSGEATSADSTGTSAENTPADSGEESWCLTLVNKWHPMTTDGSEIETVTLENGERVDQRIYPQLQAMFDAARNDGAYPIVASGYRTWAEQEEIYDEKMEEYREMGLSEDEARAETEQWVAVPGTSEHQLGLSVDINADGVHSAGYEVYDWLALHAHEYGFINRYPQDKTDITGIANEPWHYRYVGKKAAAEIVSSGLCLEEYLAG